MVVTPLLALYAFRQYYLPLPEWDRVWQLTADINSVGSPENGRIRVWSTLNSPGTFALLLGTAALALVTWRKLSVLKLLAAMAIFGALALTYVRSAWIALVLALLAVVGATRGAALKRLLPVGVVLLALAPLILTGSTGAALGERFQTFGSLSGDESAQARQSTPTALFPIAARNPVGTGLGSAGEASRLSGGTGRLRYSDNGWLSLVAQVGPVGFVVVVSVLIGAVVAAWRNAWRRVDSTDVLVFAVLTFMFVSMFASDLLYGLGGMIFWYMAGVAIRRRELSEDEA
jgi:putative inorganic carbon (hco3(-)) transporter